MVDSRLFAAAQSTCTINGQQVDCGEIAEKVSSFAAIGLILFVIFILLTAISFGFWLWMLIHCAQHNSPNKTVWLAVLGVSFVFGLALVAAILYFILEKKKAEQYNQPVQSSTSSAPPSSPSVNQ